MPEPLVSVIIPTHNRKELLLNAVKSVLAQTYPTYEIIIVDDYGNADIALKEYVDVVRIIRIPHTPYPAEARNIGLEHAFGKYIAFLDDDDTWLPEKLSYQIEVLEKNPDIGLVCSNAYLYPSDDNNALLITWNVKNEHDMLNQEILRDFVIQSTSVIRSSLLEYTGNFYAGADLLIGEDYDLSARFAAISRIYYDPRPFIRYYINPKSIQDRQSQSYVRYFRGVLTVMYRLKKFLREHQRLSFTSRIYLFYRIHDTKCDIILNRILYEHNSCNMNDIIRLIFQYFYLFPFGVPKVIKYILKSIYKGI